MPLSRVFLRDPFCCLIAAGACALAAPASLADAPAGDPLAPGSRLCLYPVTIPIENSEDDPRRASLERRIIAQLERASFEVADPAEVSARRDAILEASGGLIDRVTGRRIPERFEAYEAALARMLGDEFGCSAQAHVAVVMVRAEFNNFGADWDGTHAQVMSGGRVALTLLGGVAEYGWVSALSLWVSVLDLDGRDLAFRSAGIEPLVNFAVLVDKDLLPVDAWLTDEEAIANAIESAIGPDGSALRTRGTPAGLARDRSSR